MPCRQEEIARIQERIVEADLRMSAQLARIEQMIEKGYDVTKAKELLRQMATILDQWHVRRRLILDALAQRGVFFKKGVLRNSITFSHPLIFIE
jgi:hypothetical protein